MRVTQLTTTICFHLIINITLFHPSLQISRENLKTNSHITGNKCRDDRSNNNNNERVDNIFKALEQKVVDLFDTEYDRLKLSISKENGNLEVRSKFEGDTMISLGVIKKCDLHPNKFKEILENFSSDFMANSDPMVNRVIPLEERQGNINRKGLKVLLRFPSPFSDRIMIHWEYLKLNRAKDEHMILFSQQDNQELLKKHFTPYEQENYELGQLFLSACWIKPVYARDQNGNEKKDDNKHDNEVVVGSTIRYIFSGDVGGNIPRWIQNSAGPKTTHDSLRGLIEYANNKTK